MDCRILYDASEDIACFYCSTSGRAFGPTIEVCEAAELAGYCSADEIAEDFFQWAIKQPIAMNRGYADLRHLNYSQIESLLEEF